MNPESVGVTGGALFASGVITSAQNPRLKESETSVTLVQDLKYNSRKFQEEI